MNTRNAPALCRVHICPNPKGEGLPFCDEHWAELTEEGQGLLARFWDPEEPSPAYEAAEALILGQRAVALGFWTPQDCHAFLLETLTRLGDDAMGEAIDALRRADHGHAA